MVTSAEALPDAGERRFSSPHAHALPVTMPSPRASSLVLAAASTASICALGLLGGCCDAPARRSVSSPLFDPHAAAFDAAAPSLALAEGGSILLKGGWAQVEEAAEGFSFVWALGGRASVEVPRPREVAPGDGHDLAVHLMPLASSEERPQVLEVYSGERLLASVRLEEGWQRLRVPLPASSLAAAWNVFELRFSRSESPTQLGVGVDSRQLSAAVRELGVVPRAVPGTDSLRVTADSDAPGARRRRLTIPAGAALGVPVAPGRAVSFQVARASSECEVCQARLDHASETPAGERLETLWQGTVRDLASSRHTFSVPGQRFGRLLLSWVGPYGEEPLRLELDDDALSSSPLGDTAGGDTAEGDTADGDTAGGDTARAPDVFFYVIDTLRASDTGPYGGPWPTPSIDRLAGDAVVYHQAWTASSWTLPATISLLTGVYPDRHGIMDGHRRFEGGALPPLARVLDDAGYQTVGLSQSYVASSRFGVDRGFDTFVLDDQLNARVLRSEHLRRLFLRWLEDPARDPERPIFAYLHSVDPHAPYVPTGDFRRFADGLETELPESAFDPLTFMLEGHGEDPLAVERLRALYGGEVMYSDRQLGRFVALLEHLGLYDRSLLALVSDHGEEFFEHRGFGHGRTLYEEQLRVPLVVKFPGGGWAGDQVETPVSTLDLVPTVLEAAGVESAVALDGHPLFPDRLADAGPRLLVSLVKPSATSHLAAVDYAALRLGDLKCLESRGEVDQFGAPAAPWQVFDLEKDPLEARPLPTGDAASQRCLRLEEAWGSRRADSATPSDAVPVDEEALEQLRALGYIGG